MSSNLPLSDYYTGSYRDELTEAYEFIEDGKFPARLRETNEELKLTPYNRPYRLENWPIEDLVTYVGGIYAKEEFEQFETTQTADGVDEECASDA